MLEQSQKATPAQLDFLAIYNPSLGTTDDTIENQIVYYSSAESRGDRSRQLGQSDTKVIQDTIKEQTNEQLRQIGLAQGMVEFGGSFSEGRSVDTIETEKSRIILHELEEGWWILAYINLTILPGTAKTPTATGIAEERESIEYSSREVKPPIILLGDLLQAHSTFLLHHASSMSALFVRTRRPKFLGILGRYWDTFLSTWNVLMHGNPANKLYGGIKIAACGELGMGVGEEERGSGEREVLEGFVGRIDGLVDVIVSKFGDGDPSNEAGKPAGKKAQSLAKPAEPWLGSGNEPAAEDGAIFLGTGALSRKSLRNVSSWIEDLYRWGPNTYGVLDNPSSNRRTKISRPKAQGKKRELTTEAKSDSGQVYDLSIREKAKRQNSLKKLSPNPIENDEEHNEQKPKNSRPAFKRAISAKSFASTDSDSNKTNKFVHYLKFGYGTHWSLGSHSIRSESPLVEGQTAETPSASQSKDTTDRDLLPEAQAVPPADSVGHYLIGLLGSIENEEEEGFSSEDPENIMRYSVDTGSYNARLVLRTLTLELERDEDARAEADISIDLGFCAERHSSKHAGSEHTGTSNTSFESQDRNKTKKLRVVVYVNKPFIFVFLFELRTSALALTSLYRSLHYQIGPLHKPLLTSTSYRALKPLAATSSDNVKAPIYDLVYDTKLLTVNSTIPNIPDPLLMMSNSSELPPWSRVEAVNTHMQIINTFIATTMDRSEIERTCKTSRGWWVVWTRVPDPDFPTTMNVNSVKAPNVIAQDRLEPDSAQTPRQASGKFASRGASTTGTSLTSGPAHPFLETPLSGEYFPRNKDIFLIRRASDYIPAKPAGIFVSGSSVETDAGWAAGPGKLAQGIGVDTKRYIDGLLNLNR